MDSLNKLWAQQDEAHDSLRRGDVAGYFEAKERLKESAATHNWDYPKYAYIVRRPDEDWKGLLGERLDLIQGTYAQEMGGTSTEEERQESLDAMHDLGPMAQEMAAHGVDPSTIAAYLNGEIIMPLYEALNQDPPPDWLAEHPDLRTALEDAISAAEGAHYDVVGKYPATLEEEGGDTPEGPGCAAQVVAAAPPDWACMPTDRAIGVLSAMDPDVDLYVDGGQLIITAQNIPSALGALSAVQTSACGGKGGYTPYLPDALRDPSRPMCPVVSISAPAGVSPEELMSYMSGVFNDTAPENTTAALTTGTDQPRSPAVIPQGFCP